MWISSLYHAVNGVNGVHLMAGSVPILNTAFKILLVTNVCFTAVKIHRDSGKLADFHSTEKKKKREKKKERGLVH